MHGALVSSVEKGSAADKAGLQPGDVVRKIDDKTIVSSGDLASLITLASPGEKIKLDVWRAGVGGRPGRTARPIGPGAAPAGPAGAAGDR
ncbi:hypothetical protein G6F23_015445 [Rhizopus arrhizus]|nr:hypothetical protein G6F23_015445 [Rhizopus arrhizus]